MLDTEGVYFKMHIKFKIASQAKRDSTQQSSPFVKYADTVSNKQHYNQ